MFYESILCALPNNYQNINKNNLKTSIFLQYNAKINKMIDIYDNIKSKLSILDATNKNIKNKLCENLYLRQLLCC